MPAGSIIAGDDGCNATNGAPWRTALRDRVVTDPVVRSVTPELTAMTLVIVPAELHECFKHAQLEAFLGRTHNFQSARTERLLSLDANGFATTGPVVQEAAARARSRALNRENEPPEKSFASTEQVITDAKAAAARNALGAKNSNELSVPAQHSSRRLSSLLSWWSSEEVYKLELQGTDCTNHLPDDISAMNAHDCYFKDDDGRWNLQAGQRYTLTVTAECAADVSGFQLWIEERDTLSSDDYCISLVANGCSNACTGGPSSALFNEECSDGGPGSEHSTCNYGTDCYDCGGRTAQHTVPPTDWVASSREEIAASKWQESYTFTMPDTSEFKCSTAFGVSRAQATGFPEFQFRLQSGDYYGQWPSDGTTSFRIVEHTIIDEALAQSDETRLDVPPNLASFEDSFPIAGLGGAQFTGSVSVTCNDCYASGTCARLPLPRPQPHYSSRLPSRIAALMCTWSCAPVNGTHLKRPGYGATWT